MIHVRSQWKWTVAGVDQFNTGRSALWLSQINGDPTTRPALILPLGPAENPSNSVSAWINTPIDGVATYWIDLPAGVRVRQVRAAIPGRYPSVYMNAQLLFRPVSSKGLNAWFPWLDVPALFWADGVNRIVLQTSFEYGGPTIARCEFRGEATT